MILNLRPADTTTALFSFLLLIITAIFYKKIPPAGYLNAYICVIVYRVNSLLLTK